MKDKKHIDRLFQEKLKDFEVSPDKAVWGKINSQLNQKKSNRKVIPIWWKLTGVAAGLILLLTVGNFIFNDSDSVTNVVETEAVDSKSKKINEKNNTTVYGEKEYLKEHVDESSEESLRNDDEIIQTEILNKNKGVVNSDDSEAQKTKIESKSNQNKKANSSTNFLVNTKTNDVPKPEKTSEQPSNIINNIKKPSLNQNKNKEVIVENKTDKPNIIKKNESKNSIINNKKEEQFVLNKEKEKEEKVIIDDAILKNADDIEKEEKLVVEEEKIPLTEEFIANNENINEEEKESINRWQVNPNIAPVYFNSFGKGSPIHEQLVNNEKSGSVNMSYGINISYAVNSRLSVNSGVNKVDLGYNTNNVIIYENLGVSNPNTGLLRNIKLNNGLQSLSFVSGNSLSFAQSPSIIPGESLSSLNQEMSYYEIPLELKYKLSKKKLGFSLVGGVSTFILSDNSVSYELRGVSTELGEATNLNSTSFSANIGFGLNYAIFKNMNFNLDPMFKYQINTFSNTSGNFKPYIIGVYTGLNYKF